MRGYPVQVNSTVTMVVGGVEDEPERALGASVSYPTAAVVSNPIGGQTVYLGGINDGTSGWPLSAGSSIEIDTVSEITYGITATTSQTVYIFRRGE